MTKCPPAAAARGAPSTLALYGSRIERVLDGAVEIAEAPAADRSFPDRVTESLGICLKWGPAHEVRAAGRPHRFPADAVCIRAPGTVWSVPSTGPAGFLSLDLEPALLPPGGLSGGMRFVHRSAVPDVRSLAAVLRSDAPELTRQALVTDLVNLLLDAALVAAPGLDRPPATHAVDRARELLTSRVSNPPSLQELADAVGANRFVLLREFRRRVGMPPHAYLLRLRVDRARTMIARGAGLSHVSHALGFADQSHLSRMFKRVTGLSPAVYRSQVRTQVPRSISFTT